MNSAAPAVRKPVPMTRRMTSLANRTARTPATAANAKDPSRTLRMSLRNSHPPCTCAGRSGGILPRRRQRIADGSPTRCSAKTPVECPPASWPARACAGSLETTTPHGTRPARHHDHHDRDRARPGQHDPVRVGHEASVMVSVAVAAHALVGAIVQRRHVCWKRVLAMIALACATQPLGVAVLGVLAEQDRATVRRVFGAIVLLAVLLQVACRVKPRDRLHPGFMVGAMLASGFMGGLSGMGGPPAVLWVMAHRWSNPESRATLWVFFGGTMPVQVTLLWREFGAPVVDAIGLGLAFIPATIIGLLPGLWIGHRISKPRLRTISTIILAAIALYALLSP
ncbi:MAG: sulfite exporter TauE/SafE family protein [Planctomycetota bacterium]